MSHPGNPTRWIRSSTALPRDGQPVEFVLDHRNIAIEGTYTKCIFRSGWTSYDIGRVREWRIGASCSDDFAPDAGPNRTARVA